jgi:integrase
VRRQLGYDRELSDLKSTRSKRDVVLIPELAIVLKTHRMASRYKRPEDFVFPAPDGRGGDRRSSSRAIERAVERAGVGPLSFHGLRHGFASMLITGLKRDVETVSRQLGHANSSITLSIYSHEFDRARSTDELRTALSGTFGHLLGGSS